MTIPEAARPAVTAGAMAEGGEIFVLSMGEPVKIYNLAVNLITLSGLKPGRDCGNAGHFFQFLKLRCFQETQAALFSHRD